MTHRTGGEPGFPAAARPTALLVATGIRKEFSGTQALKGVDFDVLPGEIHGLLGENGAGKSTLVRVLGGIIRADEGTVAVNGEEVVLHSAADAFAHGISVVHQELSLMPNLTIAENICMTDLPVVRGLAGRAGVLNKAELRRRTRLAAERVGADFKPGQPVASLSPARKQLVEIARALLGSARILMLDEPTSSLPPDERQELFRRLEALRKQGIGIIFITHLLDEALGLCDRATVLRDGINVGTRSSASTSVDELIELMTGRRAGSVFPGGIARAAAVEARLSVRALQSPPRVADISFEVYPGEIVGLAGLVGSGRTETLKAIFGVSPRSAGSISIDGRAVSFARASEAIAAGVAYVPEDRQLEGLFPQHSVVTNMTIASANTTRGDRGGRRSFLLDRRRMAALAKRLVEQLGVKTPSLATPIALLSGGNQQKAVLGRWLAVDPTLVLADEPTRGVSVGSKLEIYRLLRNMAENGAAIVLVSSEFEELVGLCNRVVILRDGRSVAEVPTSNLDADGLLNLVLSG